MAVPVFRRTGEFVAALGVTGTIGHVTPDSIQSLAEQMRETGQNMILDSRRVTRDRLS